MFLAIQLLARVFNLLRSAATPRQIGAGFVLGMISGLSPSLVLSILVLLLIFVLNVNLTAAFLGIAIFGLAAFLLDPAVHYLGFLLLVELEPLTPFWTALYNFPFIPLTGFNNTVVMGSLALGVVLAAPVYLAVTRSVIGYRAGYGQKINNWKIIKLLKGSALYKWYRRLENIGDQLW